MSKLLTVFLIIIFFLRQIVVLNADADNDTYINTSNIETKSLQQLQISEQNHIRMFLQGTTI